MSKNSVAHKILKGSFWQYIASWIHRFIGFVSTLILARLLVPDDFGVVAATSIVTGLFHVISSAGTNNYLIRKKEIIDADLNTGWTINIVMKLFSAMLIFLLANHIADFMEDDRLTLVLQVLSICPILAGSHNIGMVLYEMEFNYKPKFFVGFASRVLGFCAKISLALYLQNYWAFIIAEVIEQTVSVIGSYIAHSYRPKISFKGWKAQWQFSQWVLLKSFFVFLRFKVDNIFLSKYLPLEGLGTYTVAKDVATLPSGQLIGPVMQPLYVGLSSVRKDAVLFADKAHKALSLLFLIVIPISVGTYITAGNLVQVLLGDKWQAQATPLVMILAFVLLPGILGDFLTRIMTALGKVKLIFKFELLLGLLTVGSFAALASEMLLTDYAWLRVTLTTINTLLVLTVLTSLSSLSFFRIIALILLPLTASFFMLLSIMQISEFIMFLGPISQLFFQVILGVVIYFILISSVIFLLRNTINEYQFIWKTFYLSLADKF